MSHDVAQDDPVGQSAHPGRERSSTAGQVPKRARQGSAAYRVLCTAVLTPGAITQRVDWVARPTREARRVIAAAARVKRRHVEPGDAEYRTICVSTYPDQLAELDARVERLRRGGLRGMSRSWLIRLALQLASDEQVAAMARRGR